MDLGILSSEWLNTSWFSTFKLVFECLCFLILWLQKHCFSNRISFLILLWFWSFQFWVVVLQPAVLKLATVIRNRCAAYYLPKWRMCQICSDHRLNTSAHKQPPLSHGKFVFKNDHIPYYNVHVSSFHAFRGNAWETAACVYTCMHSHMHCVLS